ncbi:uncharacterized protein LOC129962102 [Argiope bruennichi]|uniref:uncharacterized protein LOC129962102 n=1 Tax=Argiope bruennichi TaxID=94029 RepID=UPI0024956551|nr:uncharacterized protein LOC129962102 [Argiope bruennichi]
MTRVVCYAADFICNATHIMMRESRVASRNMSSILIQTVKEEDDSCTVQTENPKVVPKLQFSIRPANEGDVPALKKIRQDMGIHDVPTVFQTFMKLDPQGLKIAVSDTGKILGSCGCVFNGDDSDGVYFGGIYCVEPKYQGTGIGLKIYKECFEHFGDSNCGLNAVPGMTEIYRDRGGFPVEEKEWVCLKNQTSSYVSPDVLSNFVPQGVDIQPFHDSFLAKMVAYDQALVGFRRSLLLSMSCNEMNSKTFVAFKNGVCVGFGTIKESCLGAGRVGPLYADDPAVAEVILRKLLESFPGRNGFAMMTISSNVPANSFLRRLSCPVKEECHRLYTKKRMIVDTNKIYALFDINFSAF